MTKSHATELATFARKCAAPSMTKRTYDVAKIVVQTALKQKKIRLVESQYNTSML